MLCRIRRRWHILQLVEIVNPLQPVQQIVEKEIPGIARTRPLCVPYVPV